MEDNLELVAENRKDWKALIRDFWQDFNPTLLTAEKEAFVPKVLTDIDCPTCGAKLQKVWFKSKYFYGCSRYPDCNYTAQVEELAFNKEDYAADFDWDQKCPLDGAEMKVRHGRFGAFLGCTNYPDCKGIVNIPKKGEVVVAQEDLPACPAEGCPGHMVARKSRFGKTFYSCSTFPECDVIVNNLDDLSTKYPHHPRTAYIKKPKRGRGGKVAATKAAKTTKTAKTKKTAAEKVKKTRTMPSLKLSSELAEVVGESELPRAQVLKKVWDYIKQNNLQDSQNKRSIVPDAKLAKVFGSKEPMDMFKMTAVLSQHMKPT
jgi:DNA topoisomerase-1